MYFETWKDVEEFAHHFWARECIVKRNAAEVAEHGYLIRNMSGTVRGATSGYSPYLQAWLLADGRVVSKVTWGTHTPHGLKTFLKKINGVIAQVEGHQLDPLRALSHCRRDW
jgi:hypothetical protein